MLARLSLLFVLVAAVLVASAPNVRGQKQEPTGITVNKEARTLHIPCAIAPRKLPNLEQTYPIEVIATFPAPKGQKAHETVVTFDVKPSAVHKALEQIGLKAGKPALGERGPATGPEVRIFLDFAKEGGGRAKIPIEEALVDVKTGKAPAAMKWLFTGSAMKNPDPEKDDTVYGADLTGTLITIFPVTEDAVFQTSLSMKEEGKLKLETNPRVIPREGTPAVLIIQAK